MHYYIRLSFLLVCTYGFISSCNTQAHRNSNRKFSPQELKADLDTITRHIEKDVPNPFYSSSKTAYDSVKQKIFNELNDSMNAIQFYRTVYPLIQILNDAHFSFATGEGFFRKSDKNPHLFFPFKVMIRGDQLFVLENLSTDTIIKGGDEIISINGQPIKNIIERFRACNFKGPGEEHFFERCYGYYFHKWLFLLWGYEREFSITFINKRAITVQGITEKILFENDSPKPQGFYSFKMLPDLPDKIGYIKIATLMWDKPSRRDSLDNFLKKTFEKIKKDSIENLIIDIRNNGGGSSVLAKDIFDYITNNPLKTGLGEEYFDKGKLVRDTATSWYIPKKVANKFPGKTILLTNVMTYSSAHMMAVAFKYYHLGKTIGQVSDEPLYITGEVQKAGLPNTNCLFYYPTANFLLPGYHDNKKEHFVPDYQIYPSLQDKLNKKDTMLNFAINLFREQAFQK